MKVLFIRHGEAVERSENLKDRDRPLTSNGHEKLAKSIPYLKKVLENKKVRVCSSPLLRAIQTAQYLTDDIDIQEFVASGSFQACKQYIDNHHDYDFLIIVGHEPYLSSWIYSITKKSIEVKKGMLVELVWPSQVGQVLKLKDYQKIDL